MDTEGKSLAQMKSETAEFFKVAFCVDGKVEMVINKNTLKKLKPGAVIELNDSKRGKFYIATMINK